METKSYTLSKKLSSSKQAEGGSNYLQVSEERENLEKCLQKLNRLDEASKKLLRDGKRSSECVVEMIKCEQKLAQNLSSSTLCFYNPTLRKIMEEYFSVMKEMDQHVNEMILLNQKGFIEPLKRFVTLFNHVGNLLKKRDQFIQECQKCQVRVEKQQEKEKTGQNIVKLEQAKKNLNQVEDELNNYNHQLLQELPKLFDGRIRYFQPTFQTLVRSQMEYFGANVKLFTDLAHDIPSVPRHKDGVFSRQFQQRLSEIKSLSIVSDD